MLWIKYRKLDSFKIIPKELFYDNWKTSRTKDGYTPLMLWVYYHKYDNTIPDELKYTDW